MQLHPFLHRVEHLLAEAYVRIGGGRDPVLRDWDMIARAAGGRFVIEDWHGFGTDHDRILQAWRDNIERAWPPLPSRYDERFRRMWRFYLAVSMAIFRTRRSQLWQVVTTPTRRRWHRFGVAASRPRPRRE